MNASWSLGRIAVAIISLLTCAGLAPAEADQTKLGIVAVNYNSPTITRMVTTATAEAKSKGWAVEIFNGQGDQVATNNAAINFINRHFNAIVNIASPNEQMAAVIAKANEAKIPFVSTFSGLVPGITADIGSNNVVDGAISATELVGRINGEGHIVKLNWNVLAALRERDHGFHAVVQDYPNLKVTEVEVKVPGQVDDTYSKMTDLLLANRDIKAVWVGWDEIAIPAARAIQKAGRKDVFVVSQDGTSAAYDLIRSGSPLILTVGYDVDRMGRTAVDVTDAALKGHQPPTRLITLKPCLVTKATVPPPGKNPDFKTCTLFSGEALGLSK
jgi:ABC-type sugar transport system substrate-binding protein